MLSYATSQFPAGVLGDKMGRPLIIIVGSVVFAVAALITAGSQSFGMLLAGAAFFGLGSGAHKGLSMPLLAKKYPNQTGRVFGIVDTVGQLGGVLAPAAVVVLVAIFFWQAVFVIGTVITVLAAVLLYRSVRRDDDVQLRVKAQQIEESTGDSVMPGSQRTSNSDSTEGGLKQTSRSLQSYVAVLLRGSLLVFILAIMLQAFAWNALVSFFPLYLTSEKGLSSGMAGILYSLLFIASISQTATGELSDRIGQLSLAIILYLGMAVGTVALLLADSLLLFLCITALLGVSFHGIRPVRDSYIMKIIPLQTGGGILGIIRTLMMGFGAIGPVVTGSIADRFGFSIAFGVVTLFLFVGAILLLLIRITSEPEGQIASTATSRG